MEFSKTSGYKVNMEKQFSFLYSSNKQKIVKKTQCWASICPSRFTLHLSLHWQYLGILSGSNRLPCSPTSPSVSGSVSGNTSRRSKGGGNEDGDRITSSLSLWGCSWLAVFLSQRSQLASEGSLHRYFCLCVLGNRLLPIPLSLRVVLIL